MNKKYLQSISCVIKDKQTWDAFLAIVNFEQDKIARHLNGFKSSEELMRLNGQYTLLEHLKRLRENALNAEKEFVNE